MDREPCSNGQCPTCPFWKLVQRSWLDMIEAVKADQGSFDLATKEACRRHREAREFAKSRCPKWTAPLIQSKQS